MAVEKSSDEVVALAQQRITERKAQSQLIQDAALGERFERERPWRIAFSTALMTLVLALLFSLMAMEKTAGT